MRISSGWTNLESWLTAQRLERLPLLWTVTDVDRDSRRSPDGFWSANPAISTELIQLLCLLYKRAFESIQSLSPSVCLTCSSMCRSEGTEAGADVSQVRTESTNWCVWKDLWLLWAWQANSFCDFRLWPPLFFLQDCFHAWFDCLT